MDREWGNWERMRKWREIHSLHSSFSFYFLPFYPFPRSKIVSFCRKISNRALLSRMSQKHTHNEKIILGRIRCEKAPQAVTEKAWMINACTTEQWFGNDFSHSKTLTMMMLSPIWLQLFCKSPWGSSTAGQFFFCSHDRTIIWKPMFSFKRGGPLCREYKLLPCFRFRLKGETSWQTFPHNVFHTTIHSSYLI